MSQEGEREKKLNHNFNIERIIATTRQLSSHFTTQKSNLHWLGHNYINKTTTETSHTFLENKNCFLLLHHNEKKKVELRPTPPGTEGARAAFHLDK